MKILLALLLATFSNAAVVTGSFGPSGVTVTSAAVFQDFVFTSKAGYWRVDRYDAANKNGRMLASDGNLIRLFEGQTTWSDSLWPSHGDLEGQWLPDGSTGCVGLLTNPLDDGEMEHYRHGWLRLSWNTDRSLTLYDWAYETSLNTPITVPEKRWLFLLGGLILLRRKRTHP